MKWEWWPSNRSENEYLSARIGCIVSIRRKAGEYWVIYRNNNVIGTCDSDTPVDEVKIVAETIMKLEGNDGTV